MIAAVVAINKANVRTYISENESLENVMSDRNLCLSFMQSTRSLELGTGSEGPATKISDLQKTSPVLTTPPIPTPKRDQNGPERLAKAYKQQAICLPTSFPGARQASNNDLVAMWYPQSRAILRPSRHSLPTFFISTRRACLVLYLLTPSSQTIGKKY